MRTFACSYLEYGYKYTVYYSGFECVLQLHMRTHVHAAAAIALFAYMAAVYVYFLPSLDSYSMRIHTS